MRIGELLIKNGMITETQLARALEQQQTKPMKLGEILIEHHVISERQLVEALEFQQGISVLAYKDLVPRGECCDLVPDALVHKHCLLPIEQNRGKLRVAFYDPSDKKILDELSGLTGMEILPFLATRTDLNRAISEHYGSPKALEELRSTLQKAAGNRHTDLYVDPAGDGLVIRIRRNHRLETLRALHGREGADLLRLIRRYAGIESGTRLPQEGSFTIKLESCSLFVRVFTLPYLNGESLTLKTKEIRETLHHVDELGIREKPLRMIREQLQGSGRLVLFTSRPAHGTTSLLQSFTAELAAEGRKIIALETEGDGRQIPGVHHLPCNMERGFTVTDALRCSILQNPDVLAVDCEMNKDTIEAAARSALTGPLVLAAYRGNSAADVLRRLLVSDVNRQLLASGLSMIVNQRVVRKICSKCLQTIAATDEEMNHFEQENLLLPEDEMNTGSKTILGNFRTFVSTHKAGRLLLTRGQGCKFCDGTGFRGLAAIHEVLVMDRELGSLLKDDRTMEEIEQHAASKTYYTHRHDGLRKVKEGITTFQEIDLGSEK